MFLLMPRVDFSTVYNQIWQKVEILSSILCSIYAEKYSRGGSEYFSVLRVAKIGVNISTFRHIWL